MGIEPECQRGRNDGDGVWSVALAEGRSYLYPKPSKGLTFVWVKGNLY